jgi:hypothetical protein
VLQALKTGDTNITMEKFQLGLDYDTYINAIRSSLNSNTVFIKQSPYEIRINNYNRDVLRLWRANMDIQFVTDIYACAAYITSYVAKSARGTSDLLNKAIDEAKRGNKNLKEQVRIIGNTFLNDVGVSTQEAVYLPIQMPLRQSSRQVVFVDISPPEECVYLLRSPISQFDYNEEVCARNIISR